MTSTRVTPWNKVRLILKRGKTCELCGYNACPEILVVHHKVLKSEGGLHTEDNLIVLCPNCHALEHKKMLGGFSLEEWQERLRKWSRERYIKQPLEQRRRKFKHRNQTPMQKKEYDRLRYLAGQTRKTTLYLQGEIA